VKQDRPLLLERLLTMLTVLFRRISSCSQAVKLQDTLIDTVPQSCPRVPWEGVVCDRQVLKTKTLSSCVLCAEWYAKYKHPGKCRP